MLRILIATFTLISMFSPSVARANDLSEPGAVEVVDGLVDQLRSYFDPLVAIKVISAVEARKADFIALRDRHALAEALTAEMRAASGDKHLRVNVASPNAVPLTSEDRALLAAHQAYGLMAVRRLPGNIGYLKLRNFASGEEGIRLVEAAMLMLQHTDGLIIDLRENGGGGGGSDALLRGHLSKTPIPMVAIHWRKPDGSIEIMQREVISPDNGPLYRDKPVYLLTSADTFSAAEGFAYDLKLAGRAVLVGEPTGGAANPSNRNVILGQGMTAFIPNGHVVHPTSGGNWEGNGVMPDVFVPANEALIESYRLALIAAKPRINTPKTDQERSDALANPRAVLAADQAM